MADQQKANLDPLDKILTTRGLQSQREMERQMRFQEFAQGRPGREVGGYAVGSALRRGLGALGRATGLMPNRDDPQMEQARMGDQVRKVAMQAGEGVEDPFDRRVATVEAASTEARRLGLFDLARDLDDQLVALQQQRKELRKLGAEASKAETEADVAAVVAPENIAQEQISTQQAQRDLYLKNLQDNESWWFADQSRFEPVDVRNPAEVQAAKARGGVPGSLALQAADASGLGLTKPTQNTLQENYLASIDQLASLQTIAQTMDPEFLQIPTHLVMAAKAGLDKLGVPLPPQEAGRLAKYAEFRRNAFDSLNRYIKFITGAQMSIKEFDRLQRGFPDPEGDGPIQFDSKLRATVKSLIGMNKRARWALNNGLNFAGDQWDGIQIPDVSDAEVDAFLGSPSSVGQPRDQDAAQMKADELIRKANEARQRLREQAK